MKTSTTRTAQREQEAAEQARLADTLHRPQRDDYVSVTAQVHDPFDLIPATPDPSF